MQYVKLDDNRLQVSFSRWDSTGIKVDCQAPDKYYKLKTDYQNFSGAEQWEADIEIARAEKLENFRLAPKQYIYGYYDDGEQLSILKLKVTGNQEQQAMCDQIDAWINSVLADYYERRAIMQTAATLEELNAVSQDFSNNSASKPDIELSDILKAGAE